MGQDRDMTSISSNIALSSLTPIKRFERPAINDAASQILAVANGVEVSTLSPQTKAAGQLNAAQFESAERAKNKDEVYENLKEMAPRVAEFAKEHAERLKTAVAFQKFYIALLQERGGNSGELEAAKEMLPALEDTYDLFASGRFEKIVHGGIEGYEKMEAEKERRKGLSRDEQFALALEDHRALAVRYGLSSDLSEL